MDNHFVRERLKLALMRLGMADSLQMETEEGQWAVDLVTLTDDNNVLALYEGGELQLLKPAGMSKSTLREAAAESMMEYLLSKGATLDNFHREISGSREDLWNVDVKMMSMNGTAAWVFGGSPYTGQPKTVYMRPVQKHQRAILKGKRVEAIQEISKAKDNTDPHTWVKNDCMCCVMGHNASGGQVVAGYILMRSIRMMLIDDLPYTLLRRAGYAHRNHFAREWRQEHRSYRRAQSVWVFEFSPLSPVCLTGQVLPLPIDDYSDLPLFAMVG